MVFGVGVLIQKCFVNLFVNFDFLKKSPFKFSNLSIITKRSVALLLPKKLFIFILENY